MKELVTYLAKALVTQPEEVRVEEYTEEDGTIVFEIEVAEEEVGRMIGRRGRTANAVRQVVKACATREGKRAVVEILD